MPVKIILSLLFGVLLGLSWPTAGFNPLLFVALVPLLWLIERTKNDGFWAFSSRVFLGFFVWNAIATWWLWNATAFGMFFAMFVNSSLMTLVVLLWRRTRPTNRRCRSSISNSFHRRPSGDSLLLVAKLRLFTIDGHVAFHSYRLSIARRIVRAYQNEEDFFCAAAIVRCCCGSYLPHPCTS